MASILVIAEKEGTHAVLRAVLTVAGHEVVVSTARVTAGRYDLAVIDCGLGRVPELVGAASKHSKRVVLYTPAPSASVCTAARAAGAIGYIAPSDSPVVLLEEVQRFLGR